MAIDEFQELAGLSGGVDPLLLIRSQWHRALLYSLVATCEAVGVNPQAYLADVLMRVQSHPHSRIDELLPQSWAAGGS